MVQAAVGPKDDQRRLRVARVPLGQLSVQQSHSSSSSSAKRASAAPQKRRREGGGAKGGADCVEASDSSAGPHVVFASEAPQLAASIAWTKPRAKRQKSGAAEGQQEEVRSSAEAAAAAPSASPPALSVSPLSPLPTSSSAPTASDEALSSLRRRLEEWSASSTPSSSSSSPAFVSALSQAAALLRSRAFSSARAHLLRLSSELPCHAECGAFFVFLAYAEGQCGEGGDRAMEGRVCQHFIRAMECGAKPAADVVDAFRAFQRRRGHRVTDLLTGATPRSRPTVPSTPLSALLQRHRPSHAPLVEAVRGAAAASVLSTPSAVRVCAPPPTPRSAALRAHWTEEDGGCGGAVPSSTLGCTPRSLRLRQLRLTPDSVEDRPQPSAAVQEALLAEPRHVEEEETSGGCSPLPPSTSKSPQLARNLMSDWTEAEKEREEQEARGSSGEGTSGAPSALQPPPSPLSPLPVTDCSPPCGSSTEAADEGGEGAEDAEESLGASLDLSVPHLFDEAEFIAGLTTPNPHPMEAAQAPSTLFPPSPRPGAAALPLPSLLSLGSFGSAQRLPPSPASVCDGRGFSAAPSPSSVVVLQAVRASASHRHQLGADFFLSPVRRSTRHQATGLGPSAAAASEEEVRAELAKTNFAFVPNHHLRNTARDRGGRGGREDDCRAEAPMVATAELPPDSAEEPTGATQSATDGSSPSPLPPSQPSVTAEGRRLTVGRQGTPNPRRRPLSPLLFAVALRRRCPAPAPSAAPQSDRPPAGPLSVHRLPLQRLLRLPRPALRPPCRGLGGE